MGCGLTNNIGGKTFWSCRYYYATHFMLVTLGFASAIEAPCVIIDYLNFLFFLFSFICSEALRTNLKICGRRRKILNKKSIA